MRALWVEKYCPKDLDDIILDSSVKMMLNDYIKEGVIPNLLLFGRAGIGKTSLAKLLINELNCKTYLYINASDESGVDVVRNKIKEFSESIGLDGGLKIIILDEADGLSSHTGGSSAQDSLRNIIESCYDDTRFILTCNYLNRIISPIQSRCIPVQIKFNVKDVIKKIFYILENEKVNYKQNKKEIVNIINKNYPDIRRIIGIVEQSTISGKFEKREIDSNEGVNDVVDFIMKNFNNPRECRKYWIKNETLFNNDYLSLGSELFDRLDDSIEMILMGDHLYKMNIVLDKEIEFFCSILDLYNRRRN